MGISYLSIANGLALSLENGASDSEESHITNDQIRLQLLRAMESTESNKQK